MESIAMYLIMTPFEKFKKDVSLDFENPKNEEYCREKYFEFRAGFLGFRSVLDEEQRQKFIKVITGTIDSDDIEFCVITHKAQDFLRRATQPGLSEADNDALFKEAEKLLFEDIIPLGLRIDYEEFPEEFAVLSELNRKVENIYYKNY
jgi:hypothetical protein